jgi:alkanesulfonate monooxygenase SsuD/methylene tetrahydromethanopterin reductase-like flavin-dependent oxidoreductase (luciferase family)
MVEEFDALGIPFKDRAAMSAEQIEILKRLWEDERPHFEGRYYRFGELAFYPKPVQKPRIPLWVGGEGEPAQRRAGRYGDAWFPYYVRITPRDLAARFENVRRAAREAGRDPGEVRLNCCLPIELTREAVPQDPERLLGSPEQVMAALQGFRKIGVETVALQFMVPHLPERLEQIDRFAREVMPALRSTDA